MMSAALRSELNRIREEAGISKRQLAIQIGLDPSAITHIDRGASDPSVEKLEAWAAACGCEVRFVRAGGDADRASLLAAMAGMSAEELRLLARAAAALPNAGPARSSIIEALAQLAGLP